MSTPAILKFACLSVAVHALALTSWSSPSLPKPQVSATLSVDFATRTSLPEKSETKVPRANRTASRPARVNEEIAPERIQVKPPTASPRDGAPTLEPRTPPKRTARASTAVPMRTVAMPSVDVKAVKALADADPARRTRQGFIEPDAPPASPPREGAWRSVRSSTPQQPLASTREPQANVVSARAPPHAASASPIKDKARELARVRIRGRLETDLSRYFSYPAIARKQGWQGHVNVEFTVQPDGQLTDVRVTRSSGYHVLDQSALAALRKVGHLTEVPQWLNGQSITVELPVIYRLEN